MYIGPVYMNVYAIALVCMCLLHVHPHMVKST